MLSRNGRSRRGPARRPPTSALGGRGRGDSPHVEPGRAGRGLGRGADHDRRQAARAIARRRGQKPRRPKEMRRAPGRSPAARQRPRPRRAPAARRSGRPPRTSTTAPRLAQARRPAPRAPRSRPGRARAGRRAAPLANAARSPAARKSACGSSATRSSGNEARSAAVVGGPTEATCAPRRRASGRARAPSRRDSTALHRVRAREHDPVVAVERLERLRRAGAMSAGGTISIAGTSRTSRPRACEPLREAPATGSSGA